MDREKWGTKEILLIESLKALRQEKELTQVELAEKLHRPQSYISKYENGERRLDLIEISDICFACEKPLSEFVQQVEQRWLEKKTR